MKIINRIWFPKGNEFFVWGILALLLMIVNLTAAKFQSERMGTIVNMLWIVPLIIYWIVSIRSAQICRINKKRINQYLSKTQKSKTVKRNIGLLLPHISLCLLSISSDTYFWYVFGFSSIIGAFLLISDSHKVFFGLGLLYLLLYSLIAWIFKAILPIVIVLAVILLPFAISEIIIIRRIRQKLSVKRVYF
ncbi:MAG: hypothetical protein KKE61_20085 [Proteobacteria bacterium]|nr:hypothetical protein [Pseudomonadota bacterium]